MVTYVTSLILQCFYLVFQTRKENDYGYSLPEVRFDKHQYLNGINRGKNNNPESWDHVLGWKNVIDHVYRWSLVIRNQAQDAIENHDQKQKDCYLPVLRSFLEGVNHATRKKTTPEKAQRWKVCLSL